MKTSNSKFWYKLIIILSLVLLTQIFGPFLKEGVFAGHDTIIHFIYIKKFQDALLAGQFPVRWIDWFFPGFNHPVFNFYQPGFFYLYSLFKTIPGITHQATVNILSLSLWIASGVFMFLFTKKHFGKLCGMLAAALFVFAPYHIVEIFIRSAFPEFTAIAFVPGLFWAIKSYFDTQKGLYLSLTSIFTGLILVSHPPSLIMFSPLLLGYLLYLWQESKNRTAFLLSGLSIFLGFGIVSFFVVPAFIEQKFIQTLYLRSGFYDFHNHFVCLPQLFSTFWDYGTTTSDCTDGFSFQLGTVHWLVILIFTYLILSKFYSKIPKFKSQISYDFNIPLLSLFFFFTVLPLYMTTHISQPIWETVYYLQFIQYPWRFLIVAVFASSFLGAGLLALVLKQPAKYFVYAMLIVGVTIAYGGYMHPIKYFKNNELNLDSTEFISNYYVAQNFHPEPGYMPIWTEILPATEDRDPNEVKILEGKAKIDNLKLIAHKREYDIFIEEGGANVRFYTHYFPGWKMYLNGRETAFSYDNTYGFMDAKLPAGKQKVVLSFENTPVRTIANILSINFLIVSFASVFIFKPKTSRRTK